MLEWRCPFSDSFKLYIIQLLPEGEVNSGGYTLHKMACIRTLLQVVHSQYIYWYKTNIRMWQDI